jgi:hypothetical protein
MTVLVYCFSSPSGPVKAALLFGHPHQLAGSLGLGLLCQFFQWFSYQEMGGMHRVVQHEIGTLLARYPTTRQAQLELLHSAFIPWLATINPDSDEPKRRIACLGDLPPNPDN